MDPFATVASILGLINIAAAIASKSGPQEIQHLVSEVTTLRQILYALSDLLQKEKVETAVIPASAIQSCHSTLQDISELILKYTTKSRLGLNLRMYVNQDKLNRLKSDLDRHKATFSVILSGFTRLARPAS
jgi:hypothetical protein